MSKQCEEYSLELRLRYGARYYTVCLLTIGGQWNDENLLRSDEVFTPEIVQHLLEQKGYQGVTGVEPHWMGWHAEITKNPFLDGEEQYNGAL